MDWFPSEDSSESKTLRAERAITLGNSFREDIKTISSREIHGIYDVSEAAFDKAIGWLN